MAPAGQVASALPPWAVVRTLDVQPAEQLTMASAGSSVFACAPVNVTVKPPLPAPEAVAQVCAQPSSALIAAPRLPLLSGVPPAPKTGDVVPLSEIWNDCVAALKPASVTVWASLPPCSAFWMPASVLFWPRTIGTESAPS